MNASPFPPLELANTEFMEASDRETRRTLPRTVVGRVSQQTRRGRTPSLPAGIFRHSKLGYVWSIPKGQLAAELDEAEYEVLLPDQRSPVLDTLPVPFRWICRLELNFGPDPDGSDNDHMAAATGLLISPNHVLTAAHNLYADLFDGLHGNMREIKSVRVLPGFNCAGKVSAPFGGSTGMGWRFHEKWKDSQADEFDYGLITLKTPLGSQPQKLLSNKPLGWWSSKDHGADTRIVPHDPKNLTGKPVNLSGYPGDKCCFRPFSRQKPCKFSQVATAQFRAMGKVLDGSPAGAPRALLHDIDSFGGQSGSPIWLRWNQYRNLVALHVGGASFVDPDLSGKANAGIRITEEVVTKLCAWGWRVTRDSTGGIRGTR